MLIDIYWKDFTEQAQKEIKEMLGNNNIEKENNWDVFPVATINIEDEES